METLLTNAYTRLDQKSKQFETNSIAIGSKEKPTSKSIFLQNGIFKSLLIEWMEVKKWYGN